MGDAAAGVESEIENVLEVFCPDIFIYFLALKTVKWNLDLINPYILHITCNILYSSKDGVYRKKPRCILPIPWPYCYIDKVKPQVWF